MGSIFSGGGSSGPTAAQLELQRMQLAQEKKAAADLAAAQKKEKEQKLRLQRQRAGGAQFLSSGFQGFTVFGDSNKKSSTLG